MNELTLSPQREGAAASPVSRRALAGRVAIVTGSTSGIGLSVLEALAREGAHVVMNGFGATEEVVALADRLAAEAEVEIPFHGADMSRPEEIADLVAMTEAKFGRVDILVNNAGIQHVAPIGEFPPEKWDAIIAINLSAAFHTTRHVLPGMLRRRFGRIINIASAHGLIGSPFKSAYVAAKHGVLGLTKVTALEGAEHGVTANAICPGYVWTPWWNARSRPRQRRTRSAARRSSAMFSWRNNPTRNSRNRVRSALSPPS